jgi:2-keto-3-deoxy-L-arabinonate dehydratase
VAEIVAHEVGGSVPVIIGFASGSTEAAVQQARAYAPLRPAALMVLPPHTMKLDEQALVDHYVDLADSIEIPLMIQQSPQIPAFAHTALSVDALAAIAEHAPNALYFKIEGPGSAEKIAGLRQRLGERVALFGGIGGLGLQDELKAGAQGLLPGCGFNEVFMQVWDAWTAGDHEAVDRILQAAQPLVRAVSGFGHEFSLHARKMLLQRAGIIRHATVRRPTVTVDAAALDALARLVDTLPIRIASRPIARHNDT